MKLDMVTVSITVVLSVVVPYILLIYYGQNDSKKVKKAFRAEMELNELNLNLTEFWNLSALGIDPFAKKLLFVQMLDKRIMAKLIDLGSLQKAEIEFVWKKPNSRVKENEILEVVNLIIYRHHMPELKLEFFNRDNDYFESHEKERVEKWCREINKFAVLTRVRKVA